MAKTYCAVDAADGRTIPGVCTISPGQIELSEVPSAARPRDGGNYALGGYRLGRLAVARAVHGRSLGGHLLASAVERCMRAAASVGGTALFIDAKDADAARWYARYGAVALDDRPLSLIIPYVEFNRARIAAGLPPI